MLTLLTSNAPMLCFYIKEKSSVKRFIAQVLSEGKRIRKFYPTQTDKPVIGY